MKPFFSIGVTTYNRRELLRECLISILNQTFSDYEVIVSNDYTEEKLSLSELGINDPRVHLINQEKNLGPWRNHNFVMNSSRGRYFAWLADDDLMATTFLQSMYMALESYGSPPRIFSSYTSGSVFSGKLETEEKEGGVKELGGRQFLRAYLSGEIKTVGHYGVFAREYIAELGGLENLGTGVYSPYNDNLLAIRAGLLEKVIYIDSPLMFFRAHHGSPSDSSISIDSFISAQQDLLSKCDEILLDHKLSNDYQRNMYHLLVWCAGDIYEVSSRNISFLPEGAFNHLRALERRARSTGWLYPMFIILNLWFAAKYIIKWMFQKRGQYEAPD